MMDVGKDPFLISINEALNPATPNNEVNKTLYSFQHQVNAFIFTRYNLSSVPDIFRSIWKLLLTTAGNASSTTRLAAYRATGAFLTRVTPYYPDIIHESFSDVTLLVTIDVKSSAIIASSFAFISTYIASPLLPKFLYSAPVFHHFSSNDSAFSEHLAGIISNLGHLGNEWLKNLLQFFLEKIEESQSRYLIRAVSSIIGHNPKYYIYIILEWMGSNIQKYISLFTFLISGHQQKINDIDLFPVAKAATDMIGEGKANPADTDSALQLLSTPSDSFNVDVEDNNDGTCKISVWKKGHNDQKTEINLDISKVLKRPSFYLIHLPIDYLRPKEDDSVLVLGAKFKSLAFYTDYDITQVFDIYEPHMTKEYNETRSTVIQGMAICINKFLEGVPSEKLAAPLRRTLYVKTVSWYHSFDILRVIKNINPRLFVEKMGENYFIELLKCLIGFCCCENESLSNDSIVALVNLTSEANFEIVVKTVVERSEFFEPLLLRKSVSTVSSILSKINKTSSELLMFVDKLIEVVPLFFENLGTISEIQNFFSIFKITSPDRVKDIVNSALAIIISSVEVISGQTVEFTFQVNDLQFFKGIVETDIFNRNIDIITEPNNDYKAFMSPLKSALLCAFAYVPNEDGIFLANISHQLFPYECSCYYCNKWSEVDDALRMKILGNIHKFLRYVSDEKIHVEWCKICLKINTSLDDERYFRAIDLLKDMAVFYLTKTIGTDPTIAATYCQFLIEIHYQDNVETVTEYIKKLDLEIAYKIADLFSDITKIVSSVYTNYQKTEPIDTYFEINHESNDLPCEHIEDDQLQELFETVVRKNNVNLMSRLIRISEERNIVLEMDDLEFSHEVVPMVSNYMAKYHFVKCDISEALNQIRSDWRQYYMSAIKSDPNKLLDILMKEEKLKKAVIISLCSLVDEVRFDEDQLFELASKLVLNSHSVGKLRVNLKLMCIVVNVITQVPAKTLSSFLKKFIKSLGKNFDNLSPENTSLMFLLFARKVPLDYEIVVFIKKTFVLCGNRTQGYGFLHQILIGMSNNMKLVGRHYVQQIPEIVFPLLQSTTPSCHIIGMRLFEQISLSFSPVSSAQILPKGIDIIMERYLSHSLYPPVMEQAYRSLMSFLLKKDILQQHAVLFHCLPYRTSLDPNSAAFNASLAFMPIVMRFITPQNENFRKIYSYCESLFSYPNAFQYALRCLIEWVSRIGDDEKETLLLNSLLTWLKTIEECGQTYREPNQVGQWIETYLKFMSPSKTFSTLYFQFMKSVKFSSVYPNILKLFLQNSKDEELCQLIDDFSDLPQLNCHRAAFKLIKTCKKYKEMLQLSYFIEDCENSERLIDELTNG